MTNEPLKAGQHPVTQDIPLPGNYPCLTLQLNVTRYGAGGVGRYVVSVREPTDHVEILRYHQSADDWQELGIQILAQITSALSVMAYMQDGENR